MSISSILNITFITRCDFSRSLKQNSRRFIDLAQLLNTYDKVQQGNRSDGFLPVALDFLATDKVIWGAAVAETKILSLQQSKELPH